MKKRYVLEFIFNYLILLLIFKNINLLVSINFNDLSQFFIVYIPISYLVIKYLFINKLIKYDILKSDYYLITLLSFTILNLLFQMPIIYDICIVLMIIILKNEKEETKKQTQKNIENYFKNKK